MEKIYEIAKRLQELHVEQGKLGWTLYTVGYDFGIEKNYELITNELKNKEHFAYIKNKLNALPDGVDKRRVEIIYNMFKPYHLSDELNELNLKIQKKENELSKILNTFRYTFEGNQVSSVILSQVLSTEKSRERRKDAYFAYSQINPVLVDAGFIELVNLRKEFAKKAGYPDFISYMLDENELAQNTFDNWKTQLHEALPQMKEIRRKYAEEFLNDTVIMPWDEAYISAKIAPALNKDVDMSNYYDNIKELFNLFGIDITKYNITYDIFPRANKSEWGYNFPIETAKDTRILANVKNKFYEYGVLLHETGHAVHSYLLDPNEEMLNAGVSGIVSEGIANLFGQYRSKKVFFDQFFDQSEQASEQFKNFEEFQRINTLRALTNIFFEHSFYKNELTSLEDIYQLYWKNYQELYQEEPFSDIIPWANRIHYTTHPIYLQNYFMGDVFCEMLFKVFNERTGLNPFVDLKEFGEFIMNEVIKPSGLYKFNDLFKRISGADFTLKYLLD